MNKINRVVLNHFWQKLILDLKIQGNSENLNQKVRQAPSIICWAIFFLAWGSVVLPFSVLRKLPLFKSALYLANALVLIESQAGPPTAKAIRHSSSETKFDSVVVGSGPGGILATRRLLDAGHRVAWIEEGGTLPHAKEDFIASWFKHYSRQGLDLAHIWPPMNVMQGHVWGGGTSVNGSIYGRPSDLTLEYWQRLGAPDLAVLKASFDEIESLTNPHEVIGEFSDLRNRLFNAVENVKVLKSWHRNHSGQIQRANLMEELITPQLSTQLIRIDGSAKDLRQDSLKWKIRNSEGQEIQSDKVVLSAGCRGTPLLLKRSGILNTNRLPLGIQPFQRFIAEFDEPVHPLSGRAPPFTIPFNGKYIIGFSACSELPLRTLLGLHLKFRFIPREELKRFLIFYVSIVTSGNLSVEKYGTQVHWTKTAEDLKNAELGMSEALQLAQKVGAESIWLADPSLSMFPIERAIANAGVVVKKSIWSTYHMTSTLPFFAVPERMVIADSSQLPAVPGTNPQGSVFAYSNLLMNRSGILNS